MREHYDFTALMTIPTIRPEVLPPCKSKTCHVVRSVRGRSVHEDRDEFPGTNLRLVSEMVLHQNFLRL